MTVIIGSSLLFGIVLAIMLLCYDDGVPFGLYRGINCKVGRHMFKEGKRKKYHCAICGAKRSHPHLSVIDGGRAELRIFKN